MDKLYLVNYLSDFLKIHNFEWVDKAINWLQVDNTLLYVNKVAFAVDATTYIFDKAIEYWANMIIVHHGILWWKENSIVWVSYDRLKKLIDNNISLLSFHLPLDTHKTIGNNIVTINNIVNKLGLIEDQYSIEDFYLIWSVYVGLKLVLKDEVSTNTVRLIWEELWWKTDFYDFGDKNIKNIWVVTWAGWSLLKNQDLMKEIDIFITWEALHDALTFAKENKKNVLLWWHYETEKCWLQKIEDMLKEKGLETIFIDEKY